MKKFALLFLASWLYGDMNFEDLISKAVNHHPSIQMSQEAFKMSDEELNSAKWQYFPTPSVDFSNSSKNDQVVAKLEQPLWTGGKLDSQYDIALANKAEAGYTLEESKYKLEDLNVKSLDLDSQNTTSVDNGNIKGLVSSWTDTNDNSHEMVDVWFKTQEVTQNTISDTSAWTTSTVSEVNNQSYVVYANTQIVIDEESKTQNII